MYTLLAPEIFKEAICKRKKKKKSDAQNHVYKLEKDQWVLSSIEYLEMIISVIHGVVGMGVKTKK